MSNMFEKIFSKDNPTLAKELTQTKEQLAQVLSNQSKLEAVFGSMFDGVMVIDQCGEILLMNQTLKDLWNVTQNPVGRKPLEVIRNMEIQQLTDKVLQGKAGVTSQELSVLVPEEKFFQVHATPVIREGQVDGVVLVFHDITKLRHLERVRRDFVANVSHELRTPVATIKGYAETLLDGALDDKDNAKDFIQIIHSDADRLAKLINELLDLSRIESGQMTLALNSCRLLSIIKRVMNILQKQAHEKFVKVTINISPELNIRVDETAISQVFLNLIENAIKYNNVGGTITVSAKEKDREVIVSITDTGIGIPEEDLPRIFERFYRVDKAHSREVGGTGLGLSIVKHIIQAHDGEVTFTSHLG